VAIPYYPLSDAVLAQIIRLHLGRISARIQANHGAKLAYGDEVVRLIAARCTEPESGGRMIDAILTNTLLPAISRELLNRIASGQSTRHIDLSVADGDFRYAFG
jgi:type VI secretion system protein VasG